MIAVLIQVDVVLAGVTIPEHGTLEVVDELAYCDGDAERNVLSAGEARALVQAGYAEAIRADFEELAELMDGWQRA